MRSRIGIRHPAQALVVAFGAAIGLGTFLLALPISHVRGEGTSFTDAFFTATSATCVTGLAVVDTATHWSPFGEVVILALIQLGGFGVMTMATVGVLAISRRLGLRMRVFAQAGSGAIALGDVRPILSAIIRFTVIGEVAAAVLLTVRFWITYDEPLGRAAWLGLFHAVSAWNNAGFALYSDSLMSFATDWWISGVVGITVIIGGLGFPVLLELTERRRDHTRRGEHRRYSLHTRLTLLTTATLLIVGMGAFLLFEWDNPDTLGGLDVTGKLVTGFFQSVMPRTAGFNSLDLAALEPESQLVTMVLMFIGAGSASTGGGLKVTTLAIIALIAWSEVRGNRDVTAAGRRVPDSTQRQAITVAIIYSVAVFVSTLLLSAFSEFPIQDTLFESFSAMGTVGLSLGITPALGTVGRIVLIVMMFLGRLGAITVGTALVLREHRRMYRLPEERPIVG